MSWCLVLILVQLFHPSSSVRFNKTYENLEFISPGTSATLSSARSWCEQHGSTLAEITSDQIWNLTLRFVNEFGLNAGYIILNANGEELRAWQWINGETLTISETSSTTEMFALLSTHENGELAVTTRSPNCYQGCRIGYICEHSEDCNTQGSNNSYSLDRKCYVFHHYKSATWFEALYECQKNDEILATFPEISRRKKE